MFDLIVWFIRGALFFYKVLFFVAYILLLLAVLLIMCTAINWCPIYAIAYALGWGSYQAEILGFAVIVGWGMVLVICEHSNAVRHTVERGKEMIIQELKGR